MREAVDVVEGSTVRPRQARSLAAYGGRCVAPISAPRRGSSARRVESRQAGGAIAIARHAHEELTATGERVARSAGGVEC